MKRSYNPNPRGSSTTTVIMKSNNPFESSISLHNGGALPGMSGLGAAAPTTAPAPAPAAGFDWTSLANSLTTAGVNVGGQLATNRINQLYGPKPQPLSAPGVTYLPVGMPSSQPKRWLPIAIIGGGVVVAGLMLFAFRGKKKR